MLSDRSFFQHGIHGLIFYLERILHFYKNSKGRCGQYLNGFTESVSHMTYVHQVGQRIYASSRCPLPKQVNPNYYLYLHCNQMATTCTDKGTRLANTLSGKSCYTMYTHDPHYKHDKHCPDCQIPKNYL